MTTSPINIDPEFLRKLIAARKEAGGDLSRYAELGADLLVQDGFLDPFPPEARETVRKAMIEDLKAELTAK